MSNTVTSSEGASKQPCDRELKLKLKLKLHSSPSSLEERLQRALDNRTRLSTIRSLELPLNPNPHPDEDEEQQVQVQKQVRARHVRARHVHVQAQVPQVPSQRSSKVRVDFSTNDYLGLAHSKVQLDKVNQTYEEYIQSHNPPYLGSTGSRLLSGNSKLASALEQKLAKLHSPTLASASASVSASASALLFNSGYDANLSILSSVPMKNDYIIIDELVHNSLIMGVRMSRIPPEQVITFRHNDVRDLKKKLSLLSVILHGHGRSDGSVHVDVNKNEEDGDGDGQAQSGQLDQKGEIVIVVESVYSMDGDIAPLRHILDLAFNYGAKVVVDEAHGLGVYGKTNVEDLNIADNDNGNNGCDGFDDGFDQIQTQPQPQPQLPSENASDRNEEAAAITVGGGTGVLAALNLESHPALLASVYTFGKAAGCHGAVVIAQEVVIQYLINYARPFVYSTALPPHSLCTIQCAYDTMTGKSGEILRKKVFGLVKLFRRSLLSELEKLEKGTSTYGRDILMKSYSSIQAILCRGNEHCIRVAQLLRELGPFDVFPIRSPTVPKGEERIRIILHAHNNKEQVLRLVRCLCWSMSQSLKMGLPGSSTVSPSKL